MASAEASLAAASAGGAGSASELDDLASRYCAVRSLTEALAAPLSAEDQVVQSMPDVSPTKWHRAHTTWFFEEFVLQPHVAGFEVHDPSYRYLFNSYYEAVGPRHARDRRGLISRPGTAEAARYREATDRRVRELISGLDGRPERERDRLVELIVLGLNHEQQHQELLLMDIKHVLSCNPTSQAYQPAREPPGATDAGNPGSLGWVDVDGGLVEIGHAGGTFAFDNEEPRHRVHLERYRLADRLVTCGEWLEFIDDGGYRRPELWLSDGWVAVNAERWQSPLYWERDGDRWSVFTLTGERALRPEEPVVHISYYEADAYARWAGARLPAEAEWEHAAATSGAFGTGNDLASGLLHPAPAGAGTPGALRQLYGDVWEWTSSSYSPYPGFRPAPGAVGEYNGKFMCNQYVLRGGCAVTPAGHLRATYRNFFPPWSRWMFAGLRLAADA